ATLDGTHLHDDHLEDLSRPAIDAHVRALSGFGRRLHQIDATTLPPTEAIEHPIVASNIEARMFEFEEVRTWERNPQLYADVIGASLAGQALFAYAPEAERARRVVCKPPGTTSRRAPASSSRWGLRAGAASSSSWTSICRARSCPWMISTSL